MRCKICGREARATWMHSIEEQKEWASLDNMDECQLKAEIIDLRAQVKDLERQIE